MFILSNFALHVKLQQSLHLNAWNSLEFDSQEVCFTWIIRKHKSVLYLLQGLIVLVYVPSRQWDPLVTWYWTHPLCPLHFSKFSSWSCRNKVWLSTIIQSKSGVVTNLHWIGMAVKTKVLQWNSTAVSECSTAKQISVMERVCMWGKMLINTVLSN